MVLGTVEVAFVRGTQSSSLPAHHKLFPPVQGAQRQLGFQVGMQTIASTSVPEPLSILSCCHHHLVSLPILVALFFLNPLPLYRVTLKAQTSLF